MLNEWEFINDIIELKAMLYICEFYTLEIAYYVVCNKNIFLFK